MLARVLSVATVVAAVAWTAGRPATATATTAPPGGTPLGIAHKTLQHGTINCLTIGILRMGIGT